MSLFREKPEQVALGEQVRQLVELTDSTDWRLDRGRLVFIPDPRIRFYLDYTAWRQGGTDRQVGHEGWKALNGVWAAIKARDAEDSALALCGAIELRESRR